MPQNFLRPLLLPPAHACFLERILELRELRGREEAALREAAPTPVVELVRWIVVSPTHQGSNPGARIISGFISGFPTMRFQWEETFPLTTS